MILGQPATVLWGFLRLHQCGAMTQPSHHFFSIHTTSKPSCLPSQDFLEPLFAHL